jgi:hypothetical protein
MTSAGATGSDDFLATFGAHPATITVLIDFFPSAGLKCPFHRVCTIYLIIVPLIAKRAQMYLIFPKITPSGWKKLDHWILQTHGSISEAGASPASTPLILFIHSWI